MLNRMNNYIDFVAGRISLIISIIISLILGLICEAC